jgi:Ca2+-binding EF-hand superfamily protein
VTIGQFPDLSQIPWRLKKMSKKVLLIAGVLLAAGSIAAVSAPHFRGGHMHRGSLFGELGEGGFGPLPIRLGERLQSMDADKDGAVTLDEFLSRRAPSFARLDKNGDGAIDAGEFEAAAKESADYWTRRFLKRFDADRDGRISKDEFAKARRERFAMRDLNDYGRLGLEDAPPGMRERFGRWRERQEGKDAKDGGGFTLERLTQRLDRRFGRLDKNGDGFIAVRCRPRRQGDQG